MQQAAASVSGSRVRSARGASKADRLTDSQLMKPAVVGGAKSFALCKLLLRTSVDKTVHGTTYFQQCVSLLIGASLTKISVFLCFHKALCGLLSPFCTMYMYRISTCFSEFTESRRCYSVYLVVKIGASICLIQERDFNGVRLACIWCL